MLRVFTVKAQCIIFLEIYSMVRIQIVRSMPFKLKKTPVYQYLIEKLVYLNVNPNTVNDKETVLVDKIHEL